MRTKQVLLFAITFSLVGCAAGVKTQPRELPDAEEVSRADGGCQTVAQMEMDAWNSHDIETIRSIFTVDIVHDDGDSYFKGIDEVSEMAATVFIFFPELGNRVTQIFIGDGECLGVYEYWNLELGGVQYTQAAPAIEVDLFEIRDARIAYWTLFDGLATIERRRSADKEHLKGARDLLESYTAAWSSGDANKVSPLYAQGAVRKDPVFHERQEGREQIRAFAEAFFNWYPNVEWELSLAYNGHVDGLPAAGATYSIHTGEDECAISAAVILVMGEGGIVDETIYYDADSLMKCGWVR